MNFIKELVIVILILITFNRCLQTTPTANLPPCPPSAQQWLHRGVNTDCHFSLKITDFRMLDDNTASSLASAQNTTFKIVFIMFLQHGYVDTTSTWSICLCRCGLTTPKLSTAACRTEHN